MFEGAEGLLLAEKFEAFGVGELGLTGAVLEAGKLAVYGFVPKAFEDSTFIGVAGITFQGFFGVKDFSAIGDGVGDEVASGFVIKGVEKASHAIPGILSKSGEAGFDDAPGHGMLNPSEIEVVGDPTNQVVVGQEDRKSTRLNSSH